LLFAVAACGWGRPDFSGTWVESDGPQITVRPHDPDLETRVIIQQNGNTMTSRVLVNSKSNSTQKTNLPPISFDLDGTEKRDRVGSVSKAYWQGKSLVFETTTSNTRGETSKMTITWSMDSSGRIVLDHLLINSTNPKPARYRSTMKRVQP